MTSRLGPRFKAFTLIEMITVVAIIAILASIAAINFGKVQSRSRDTRRKADVRTYEAAIEKFRLTDSTTPDVGVSASFYGRMNFTGSQGGSVDYPASVAEPTVKTISEFLLKRGLISSVVRDPSAPANNTSVDKVDYVLIRCNAGGTQITTATTEVSFAVWAKLENANSGNDAENTATYCGGAAGTKFGYNNNASAPFPSSTGSRVDATKYFSSGNKKTQ